MRTKTGTITKRKISVYAPTLELKARWEREAKMRGKSLSSLMGEVYDAFIESDDEDRLDDRAELLILAREHDKEVVAQEEDIQRLKNLTDRQERVLSEEEKKNKELAQKNKAQTQELRAKDLEIKEVRTASARSSFDREVGRFFTKEVGEIGESIAKLKPSVEEYAKSYDQGKPYDGDFPQDGPSAPAPKPTTTILGGSPGNVVTPTTALEMGITVLIVPPRRNSSFTTEE